MFDGQTNLAKIALWWSFTAQEARVGKVRVSDTQAMNHYFVSTWQTVDNNRFDYGLYFEELDVGIQVPTQLPNIFYVTRYEWFEVCVRDLSV
jgi:hypothetical protein